MKRNIFISLLVILSSYCFAQTEFDAVTMDKPDLNGSARYIGLAGAYGALGGDASAIKDNPAGLGVFRSSEISFTAKLGMQKSSSNWNGSTSSADNFKLNFDHFSYSWNVPNYQESGLISSNYIIAYNKIKNFNREMSIQGSSSGYSLADVMANMANIANNGNGLNYNALSFKNDPYNNTSIGWLSELGYQAYLIDTVPGQTSKYASVLTPKQSVVPYNYLKESGGINEYTFGWGGNFNNNFFLGANINLVTLNYELTSQYSESFRENSNEGFDLVNYISQSGAGINLKLGAIYMPVNSLRLGFSVHTPTVYSIKNTHYADIYSSYMTQTPESTITGSDEFSFRSPWQIQASAAYLFGRKGLISAEYDRIWQKNAKYTNTDGTIKGFEDANMAITNDLENSNFFKFGGEYKVNDNIALRAGYAFSNAVNPTSAQGKPIYYNSTYTNTEYLLNKGTQFCTLGVGYREASWFLDFAYVLKTEKNDFYPFKYNYFSDVTITPADVKVNSNNLVVTLGFKF